MIVKPSRSLSRLIAWFILRFIWMWFGFLSCIEREQWSSDRGRRAGGRGSGARRGRRRAAVVFSEAWRPAGVSERRAGDRFLVPDNRPSEMSFTCSLPSLPGSRLLNNRPTHCRDGRRAGSSSFIDTEWSRIRKTEDQADNYHYV